MKGCFVIPSSLLWLLLVWILLLLSASAAHCFGLQVRLSPRCCRSAAADWRACWWGVGENKFALSLAFNRTRLLIINCSPDTAGAVGAVSVFNHTVFVLAGLIGTRCSVMMLLATRIQALAQRTLNGEISAWLWLEMAIVYLHLHDSHKLNLTC